MSQGARLTPVCSATAEASETDLNTDLWFPGGDLLGELMPGWAVRWGPRLRVHGGGSCLCSPRGR